MQNNLVWVSNEISLKLLTKTGKQTTVLALEWECKAIYRDLNFPLDWHNQDVETAASLTCVTRYFRVCDECQPN